MKKYLDIACGEAPHWLVESLNNPHVVYVGVDTRPWKMSPKELYWKTKESILEDAVDKINLCPIGEYKKSLEDLVTASWLIDAENKEIEEILKFCAATHDREYYDIDKLAENMSQYPEVDKILSAKISDILYDDKKIAEVYYDKFPRVAGENDQKVVFNSGFYAYNQIKKTLFGNLASHPILDILKKPFPSKLEGRLKDALSRIHFVQGSMYDLPFKSKSFDYVRGSGQPSLQEEKAMSEAQRVLKSGRIVKIGVSGIYTEFE